ncbi:MAG: M3 family oligoendopeptidase [Candidatus Paceibacterota bacterium]
MTKKVPTKIKTDWSLNKIYTSPQDAQIEKDIHVAENAYAYFAKKYSNTKKYLLTDKALYKALEDQEKLAEKVSLGSKAIMYFAYRQELNSFDTKAEAMVAKLSNRLTQAGNEILFFDIALGLIPTKKQKEYLKSPLLKKYRYLLERTFLESSYQLSEKEEKIMSLKSLPAHSMWIDGQEKLQKKQVVIFKGKEVPIAEAFNRISDLPTKDRRALHQKSMEVLKATSDFAESEINAVFTDKKINDELRGFKEPYSATILGYENDEESIKNLVETVTQDFSTSREFYALKKKLLKLKDFNYSDRSVSIGEVKKRFSFEDSYCILREIFYGLGKEYGEILDTFVKEGHVDAFPKKGKSGGAYCSSGHGTPTLVLLNHVPSFNSLMTFAHEMGHAIHAELSKQQGVLYEGHSTSVAETASTFFEAVVFNAIFETLTDKEKVIALHDKIQSDVSTIYRQIAFFNFELALHKKIRAEGYVSKEDIAKLLNKNMKAYIGSSMKFTPEDGYFFVTVSHFRRPFYVYSYTYGQLISKALYEKYKGDQTYEEKIHQFLSAGGSKSPEDIFAEIGLDTSSSRLFKNGLLSIKKDIALLKKLSQK